jgi:predicted nucleotidyltransferase
MYPLRATRQPADKEALDAEIAAIKSHILASIHPAAIYLFGSAARNDATTHSDIDIAIIMPDAAAIPAARKALRKTRMKRHFPVDFVWFGAEEFTTRKALGGLASTIEAEGICLYRGAEDGQG